MELLALGTGGSNEVHDNKDSGHSDDYGVASSGYSTLGNGALAVHTVIGPLVGGTMYPLVGPLAVGNNRAPGHR